MATAPHSPAEKQTSVIQLYKIPVLVSSGTVFEFGRLAASCAPVPGLSPVVEVLQKVCIQHLTDGLAHVSKLLNASRHGFLDL